MNRENLKQQLIDNEWDVVVIGGGATGLGVALDAVTRGLKVALIEKKDYASGPTSTSTKLIHGGVRYLEKAIKEMDFGQFQLVQEALHERQIMLNNAPHLGKPIPFIIPVYSFWQKFYYYIGTKIYDWVAGKDHIPNSQMLSKEKSIGFFPLLNQEKLKGSIVYYDGQFNDAFYATALLRTAIQYGACCLNYMELTDNQWDTIHKIHHLTVKDNFTAQKYNLRTKVVVNCAGVQSDSVRKLFIPNVEPRLRPSKGIHIVLPREWLKSQHSLLIPSTEDGRVMFVIPWFYCVIIGTTDTEVSDPNSNPEVTEEDIDYLLRQVNPYLSSPIQKKEIIAHFAGYRPLVKANKSKTEALIRNHEVEVFHEKNFISVLGGKWTTYRKMAEDAVNKVFELLNTKKVPCKTAQIPLIGATSVPFQNTYHLPEAIHRHLQWYGSEYSIVWEYLKNKGSDVMVERYPFTVGEMYFLKEHAQIHTVHDALHRGTRLAIIDFQAAEKAKNTLKAIFES